MPTKPAAARSPRGRIIEVLLTSTKLGLTSFGGPIAHLGYFRTEYVDRKRWLSAQEYADLVSLCQFLPGPASSQVGIAIGLKRAGIPGAVAAWAGFTGPSAIALAAFAMGLAQQVPSGILHGLMLVAVAVVAQALWQMARTACRGPIEIAIAVTALAASLAWRSAWLQTAIVALSLVFGWALFRRTTAAAEPGEVDLTISKRAGLISLGLFAALLVALPVLARVSSVLAVDVLDTFYRVGSMVFGGGHVVLPLLESQVVAPGWVTPDEFVAGYGAAQAVPGPLFTFAAYLGASMTDPVVMTIMATVGIFLPSFLLVIGVMPFWGGLRGNVQMRAALRGVNAAVVGILGAAFYRPVITSAIFDARDALIALAAFGVLVWLKLPPWAVVIGIALIGWLLGD